MDAVETFEHCGLKVEIHLDDSGIAGLGDPRDADNLGIMYCQHRRYQLGDAAYRAHIDEYDFVDSAWEDCRNRGYGLRTLERYLRACLGATVVLPLYLYDHSGITMSTGSFSHIDHGNWDSGMVGIIFDTAKTREMTGAPLDTIERQLENEVKYYAAFLEGNIYGYTVSKVDECNLGHKHEEVLDSCWGYLVADNEDMEYLRSEAKASAEAECDG